MTLVVKNLPANAGDERCGFESPLEEEMATHTSILAWEKSHGRRSLAGYRTRDHRGSDMSSD